MDEIPKLQIFQHEWDRRLLILTLNIATILKKVVTRRKVYDIPKTAPALSAVPQLP